MDEEILKAIAKAREEAKAKEIDLSVLNVYLEAA